MLGAISACGDDPAAADVPTTLEVVSGDEQVGEVARALADPLAIRVLDQNGDPLAGVTVTWSADAGGSVQPVTSQTDEDGAARRRWSTDSGSRSPRAR